MRTVEFQLNKSINKLKTDIRNYFRICMYNKRLEISGKKKMRVDSFVNDTSFVGMIQII